MVSQPRSPSETVAKIEGVLRGTRKGVELEELAWRYAGMCEEANSRLERCVDQLRHGQLAEAIRASVPESCRGGQRIGIQCEQVRWAEFRGR